jgi:hypothetical protein
MRANSKEIDVIKKDNRLIEAKYKLTIHEQRLLWVLLIPLPTSFIYH